MFWLLGGSAAVRKLRDPSIPCQAVVGSLADVCGEREREVVDRGFVWMFCRDRHDW